MGALWLTIPPEPVCGFLTPLAPPQAPDVAEATERAPARYDGLDFRPTQAMARAADRGLRYRREHGRGGTAVGVARARDIRNRVNLSPITVRRMKAYFDRHQGDKDAEGSDDRGYWGDADNPSAGWIAWLLWGGDTGRAWASRLVRQMDDRDDEKRGADPMGFVARQHAAVTETDRARQWRGWVRRVHAPTERRMARAWARYLRGAGERIAARVAAVLESPAERAHKRSIKRRQKRLPAIPGTVARQWDPRDLEVVMDSAEEAAIARAVLAPAVDAALRAGFDNIRAQITAAALTWDPTVNPSDRIIGQMIVQVEQFTKARVNDLVAAALERGDTIGEITAALQLDVGFSAQRALRIARTEATKAVNRGQAIAYEQAEAAGVRLRVAWLSSRDSEVRPSHEALDAEPPIRVGELFTIPPGFENSGSQAPYPGEFDEAAEVVNCRCSTTPIVDE